MPSNLGHMKTSPYEGTSSAKSGTRGAASALKSGAASGSTGRNRKARLQMIFARMNEMRKG